MNIIRKADICFLLVVFVLLTACVGRDLQPYQSQEGKEFTIRLENFRLTPGVITVDRGAVVKITVVNVEGEHNLFIEEYNLRTEISLVRTSQTIEFVADETGEFDMWCEVRDHRSLGMDGRLIVKG